MANVFSDHFPTDPAASLSYRDLGGHVKAAHFRFLNSSGNIIAPSERIWLTALPPSSRIIFGFITITGSFGAGLTATLRRETGNVNLLTGGRTINMDNPTSPFYIDRLGHGSGSVMPEKPSNPRGERIGLALSANSGAGAGAGFGVIFYV